MNEYEYVCECESQVEFPFLCIKYKSGLLLHVYMYVHYLDSLSYCNSRTHITVPSVFSPYSLAPSSLILSHSHSHSSLMLARAWLAMAHVCTLSFSSVSTWLAVCGETKDCFKCRCWHQRRGQERTGEENGEEEAAKAHRRSISG